jgi:hypothetical protein
MLAETMIPALLKSIVWADKDPEAIKIVIAKSLKKFNDVFIFSWFIYFSFLNFNGSAFIIQHRQPLQHL